MNARPLTVIFALAALLAVTPLAAQTVQLDLGLGYQWLDVTGNEDVYRTQTRQQDGAILDSLSLLILEPKGQGLFDRIRFDAAGFGASPDTRVRLQAGLAGVYSLRLGYSRVEVFNALPGFANPFLGSGVTPGQHTMDRRREVFSLDLELLPGGTVTPLVGFSRSNYRGPSTSTYFLGRDEFRLLSHLDEQVDEIRAGIAFALGTWRGTAVQGWRSTEATSVFSLAAGEHDGNNARPVLGRDIYANVFDRTSKASIDAPFTNASFSGYLGERVRLVGSFARSDGESDTSEFESANGQFVSFELRRFFTGLEDSATGHAESPSWRGEARVEADLLPWLDLTAAYTSSHRELDGEALVATSFLGTVNYSGFDPRDVQAVLDAASAWERDEDVGEVRLRARPLTWLRVWGSAAKASQDVTITPAAAEIVVPGGQGGTYYRGIDRFSAGADATFGPLSLAAEWDSDDADAALVRTDYLERTKVKVRASLKIAAWLRVLGIGERIEASNPTSFIDYDATTEHWAADIEVTPLQALTVRAGYDSFQSDSRITIRRPEDFSLEPSLYAEDADNVEGSLLFNIGRFTAEAGGNRYSNKGSLPFDLDRTFARLDVVLTDAIGVYGQFEHRAYSETLLPLADYESDRYGLFLRWAVK